MNDKDNLKILDKYIGNLKVKRSVLAEKIRAEKSATIIEALGITLEDVELSCEEGKPFWDTVYNFMDWVKENSQKKYYEWNTLVYPVGSFNESLCRLEDLA